MDYKLGPVESSHHVSNKESIQKAETLSKNTVLIDSALETTKKDKDDERIAKNSLSCKVPASSSSPAFRLCNENCKGNVSNFKGKSQSADTKPKKRYHCQYCQRCFSQKGGLNIHERIHLGHKPFNCEMCGATFYDKSNLRKHQRIHIGDKKFSCDNCDFTCTDPGNLKKHKQTHLDVTNRKKYKCPYCAQEFLTTTGLSEHVNAHRGEKPHACAYCDKSFASFMDKRRHEFIHMTDKPYKCHFEGCTRSFAQCTEFKSHVMRMHTDERPYKCDLCDKTYARNNDRMHHQRLHFKENFIKCSYCSRSFKTLAGKKYHQNAEHLHQRPYACKYANCGMDFYDKSTRSKHELRCLFGPSFDTTAPESEPCNVTES